MEKSKFFIFGRFQWLLVQNIPIWQLRYCSTQFDYKTDMYLVCSWSKCFILKWDVIIQKVWKFSFFKHICILIVHWLQLTLKIMSLPEQFGRKTSCWSAGVLLITFFWIFSVGLNINRVQGQNSNVRGLHNNLLACFFKKKSNDYFFQKMQNTD